MTPEALSAVRRAQWKLRKQRWGPSGTELALAEAKRHIKILTAFFMDNPQWVRAAEEARRWMNGPPVHPPAPDGKERG